GLQKEIQKWGVQKGGRPRCKNLEGDRRDHPRRRGVPFGHLPADGPMELVDAGTLRPSRHWVLAGPGHLRDGQDPVRLWRGRQKTPRGVPSQKKVPLVQWTWVFHGRRF